MAAQQGFQYEINAAKALVPLGLVPAGFAPAGARHDTADLTLLYKNKKEGCELKISAASAGSLVLKYDFAKKSWGFGNIKPDEDEKIFLRDLANDFKLFDLIRTNWKEIPLKRDNDPNLKAFTTSMSKQQLYERDLGAFKDIKGEIPASKIEQYYNKKKTYYVNIGTHGFYLLGTINPYKLKGVPRFGDSATATCRARVQYKGGQNYQFTFEMQFSMKRKSPFNIAPVNGSSVNIDMSKLNVSCFI
jgi:hypothetical protein